MSVKIVREYRGQQVAVELVRCEPNPYSDGVQFRVARTINGTCRSEVVRTRAITALRAALHLGYTRIDRSFVNFGEWRENHDHRQG
jgi:hypothetical protein